MKNGFIVIILTTDNRIGFYDGTGFDTLKRKAKVYTAARTAANDARKFGNMEHVKKAISLPKNASVKEVRDSLTKRVIKKVVKRRAPAKKKRVVKKKNPIEGSRKRRETKAATLFEDFTGHPADSFEMVRLPEYDTGLKVGKVIGIMYETTRDGNIEKYVHEFRKTSQPDFAISHDGQQIFLIGGSYLFKDSGINDT